MVADPRFEDRTLPCPHCGASAQFAFRARDLNLKVSRVLFTYFRCPGCRLLFLGDAPDDLERYYPSNYYALPADRPRLEALAAKEGFKLDLIRPFRAGGDLLEIGPAWGSFAFAAKSAGYHVSAVEMDERCCRYLEHEVGVEVFRADPDELPAGLGNYDVIALWHVIEHLRNFERTLLTLAGLVRSGGVLAIASPNPASWQFRLMERRWPHVDAPRHLQLIPVPLIVDVLAACGFEVALATFSDPGARRWNRFSWQRMIMNALPSSRLSTAAGLVSGAALGALMRPLDARESAGAAYTLILKKTRGVEAEAGVAAATSRSRS